MESGLLYDAYIANQSMVSECWLSSIKFILQKLNIQHTGIKLNELVRSVRKKLCHSFLNYWNKKSKEPEGKLDTYLKIKKCFSGETYLSINNFRLRRLLCQIRTHELKIERDRYKKPHVERSQRICEKCSSNQTEDELHFIINCPLYIDNREIMFNNIGELCPKFKDLPNEAKCIWLFTNEDISVLELLGKYIIDCLDIRRGDYCCHK